MIKIEVFNSNEPKLLHLANLWNHAETFPSKYDKLFMSNPHELAALIGNGTTYNDWQTFLSDSRVQNYVDKMLYTQAGIIVNKLMNQPHMSVSDATKLNTAVGYRDNHKQDFATPVQYIITAVPHTTAEQAFLRGKGNDKSVEDVV